MTKLFLKHPILFLAVWWKLKTDEGNDYINHFKKNVKENLFGRK